MSFNFAGVYSASYYTLRQCSDTRCLVTGWPSGLEKGWVWFVYGDDLTGALHIL